MSNKVVDQSVTFRSREGLNPVERQFLAIPPQLDKHIQAPISKPPVLKRDHILLKDSGSTEEELTFSNKWQIRLPNKLTSSSNIESVKQTQVQTKGKLKASGKLYHEELLRAKIQRPVSRIVLEDYNVQSKNRLEEKIHRAEEKMRQLTNSYKAVCAQKQAILEHKQVRHVKSMESILKNEIKKT